jgi:ribonuclease BN (tRNA processing enzyme)
VSSKLVILGSIGGPTPKLQGHATSHALVMQNDTNVVDCGSGVARQLIRAGIGLATLKRIFITHHHIDHVADFGLLVHQSWSQLKHPVELIGPPPLARMVELYLELYRPDIESRVADENRRHLREFIRVREITHPGDILRDERVSVRCALVEHPPLDRVFAYRFDAPEGSVVFSADTVPARSLIALAQGADVLVHEALYLDNAAQFLPADRAQSVLNRMLRAHSQPSDAGCIAREAGVRLLILSPLGAFGEIDEARLKQRAAEQFGGEIRVGHDLLEVDLPLPSRGRGPADS